MEGELKSIKLAIRMETEAALFYQKASQMTSDPRAREILARFAQDEEKHRRMLEYGVEKHYMKQGSFDFPELETVPEYGADNLSPIYSRKLAELKGEPEPVMTAVKKFAQAESQAIVLYRKLAENSREESFKKFFTALAEWEERHLRLLVQQAKAFEEDK